MKKRQRIKKMCMVSVILIVIIWFMIYLTRFEVKNNNLQAEAGTSIEYILNENNLHDYISVSSFIQNRLTIMSSTAWSVRTTLSWIRPLHTFIILMETCAGKRYMIIHRVRICGCRRRSSRRRRSCMSTQLTALIC